MRYTNNWKRKASLYTMNSRVSCVAQIQTRFRKDQTDKALENQKNNNYQINSNNLQPSIQTVKQNSSQDILL